MGGWQRSAGRLTHAVVFKAGHMAPHVSGLLTARPMRPSYSAALCVCVSLPLVLCLSRHLRVPRPQDQPLAVNHMLFSWIWSVLDEF